MANVLKYTASPTLEAFHSAPVGSYEFKGIRGVVGSGKSVGCCWDIRTKAEMQPPCEWPERMPDGKFHKVRPSKWLIGRQTFPQLKNTTVPTWRQWFPDTYIVESPPMHGLLQAPSMHCDGSWVRIELVFYAFESPTIETDLPSLEISGAWINEACQVKWDLIHLTNTRVGRYQPVKGVMLNSFGVIMDTNTPNESNWWHRLEVQERPDGMLWFVQPPAMIREVREGKVRYLDNDEDNARRYGLRPAENIENLKDGFGYYRKQLVGGSDDKIKRLILNQYGTTADGLPIFPEWSEEVHAKDRLDVFKGLPFVLGTDFGRTPATAVCQMGPDGVFRVLFEVTSENMSIDQFVDEMLRPALAREIGWPNCRAVNFADPAGLSKGQQFNITCIDIMNRKGIPTMPSPDKSNSFQARRDAVANLMRQMYKGVPALQVDRGKCPVIVKGMNGWYCYKHLRQAADYGERYAEGPDKTNPFTHIQDALQYAVLGATCGGVDFSSPSQAMPNYDQSGTEWGVSFDLV